MIKLKYNNTYYNLLNDYIVKKSSREVSFNNIVVDFTNKTITDLPKKYQECQIIKITNGEEKTIFTGYINNFVLPNMKNKEEYRELEIELLSPMALSTRRTITAIGNYKLQDLINIILQPLYNDGFILKELNISNNELTVNYLIETVESTLNKLSNKYNFWWYIDENKNIYINSIDYQFGLEPKLVYNEDIKLKGLKDLVPSIDATDYCNVINFTNVRVWQFSYSGAFTTASLTPITYNLEKDSLIDRTQAIKNNVEIEFNHPIDINVVNIEKSINSNSQHIVFTNYNNYAFYMQYTYSDNTTGTVYILKNGNNLTISSNATIEENPQTTKEFEFKRDTFFSNLITGFKYNNGSKTITSIQTLFSCSALMWTRLKINNLEEINASKNRISLSGQVEKIINMNEQWKTFDELQEIGNAYLKTNSSQADNIKMVFDENYNFKIGNIIKIDRPNFLIQGKYIITDITEKWLSKGYNEYTLMLRNSNYFENYVDLFRYNETEEIDEKVYNLTTIDYNEDSIREVHEVS